MGIELRLGDCREVMAELADNSIDAVVTDPPYEIAFMGKKWDSTAIAYDSRVWSEVLRVLKPGGYVLAFGATRTYHRLACAIEDAGFEIRDCVMWVYGCLDEETEIMTDHGWEHNRIAIASSQILCYDMASDSFAWHKPERIFAYEYDDTAYHIVSDSTDQLVSRNHRCIVERGGRKVFTYAETLQCQESVPILEDLQGLLEALYDVQLNAGPTQWNMQQGMPCAAQPQSAQGEAASSTGGNGQADLSDMRQNILPVQESCRAQQSESLQPEVPVHVAGSRSRAYSPFAEDCQHGARCLDGREPKIISREYERAEQPSMEGRSNVFSQTWQLSANQICALPGTIFANGSEGRLCDGASLDSCAMSWQAAQAERGRASFRSRSNEQRPQELGAIQEQSASQVIRGGRFTRSTLATVTPVRYKGIMWCVQVPTGAFVARRRGLMFVTGNSGFPKSLDISKAVDKRLGREPIRTGKIRVAADGTPMHKNGSDKQAEGWARPWMDRAPEEQNTLWETTPATPEAAQWRGWGTALKPAVEPIVMARKPLSEKTVVANVLRWGTAGINIDGCRIPFQNNADKEGWRYGAAGKENSSDLSWKNTSRQIIQNEAAGRWPANLILDEVAAEMLDEQSGELKAGCAIRRHSGGKTFGSARAKPPLDDMGYPGGGGASRFFYCAKASQKERNGSKHPTVKPVALMHYLVRLVTPPEGTVLDPFMGTGTTGQAALEEGFSFIGIELERESYEDACKRLEQTQPALELA